MTKTLIIKLGAAGDVVRTTTLLNILTGEIHWLVADNNIELLNGIPEISECIPWTKRILLDGRQYDLAINLEDSPDPAQILRRIKYRQLFGSYPDHSEKVSYTPDSGQWFDLSLISRWGKSEADELKFLNKKTYQEMIFGGLGHVFTGQRYFLPKATVSDLEGDIALAPKSGAVWPMKDWAYFEELRLRLQGDGYKVNILPIRQTLVEHIGDIQNHNYLISGDSLPMHLALGSGVKCLTIFICTSPWEICDYGLQQKIVSPLLKEFFYKRGFDIRATRSISMDEVYLEVLRGMKDVKGVEGVEMDFGIRQSCQKEKN